MIIRPQRQNPLSHMQQLGTKAAMVAALSSSAAGYYHRDTIVAAAAHSERHQAYASAEHYDLLDFRVRWPTEVSAEPELAAKLKAEVDRKRRSLLENARVDRIEGYKTDRWFHADYELMGETPQLLSILAITDQWTGGVHRWISGEPRLWDRKAGYEIGLDELFDKTSLHKQLDRVACRRLDEIANIRARARGDQPFDTSKDCRWLVGNRIKIAPMDKDRNGKFDSFALFVQSAMGDPYDWESYRAEAPLTAAMVRAVSKDYRDSFEVRPQPQ